MGNFLQSGPKPQNPNLLQQPAVHGSDALHSGASWALLRPRRHIRSAQRAYGRRRFDATIVRSLSRNQRDRSLRSESWREVNGGDVVKDVEKRVQGPPATQTPKGFWLGENVQLAIANHLQCCNERLTCPSIPKDHMPWRETEVCSTLDRD